MRNKINIQEFTVWYLPGKNINKNIISGTLHQETGKEASTYIETSPIKPRKANQEKPQENSRERESSNNES